MDSGLLWFAQSFISIFCMTIVYLFIVKKESFGGKKGKQASQNRKKNVICGKVLSHFYLCHLEPLLTLALNHLPADVN